MAAIAACRAGPTPALTSAEDAAKKKHTDCVYFLASPLTCKKGAECEFRHSEAARINPKDCWYWLAGGCRNRDCHFRHPPLDARPEAPAAAPQPANGNKGRPPCYYYAQGYCAKGERCSFMHAVAPTPTLVPKPALAPQVDAAPKAQQRQEVALKFTPRIELKSAAPASQPRAPPAEASRPIHPAPVRKPETTQVTVTRVAARRSEPVAARKSEPVAKPAVARKPEAANNRLPETIQAPPRQAFVPARNRLSPRTLREEINRNSSPEVESSTHELEDEELQPRSDYCGRDENSPGFDVLVDDGPEQLHYMDEGDYNLHNEDGSRFEDGEFSEPFARRGGYDRSSFGRYEDWDYERNGMRVDYDRPRHDQVDNLERDYYKKSSSIKDRLVFNGGDNRLLDSGDLRNVLERRKSRGDMRQQQRNDQQQQPQQRRYVQRVFNPQERAFTTRPSRVEPRRGPPFRDASPPEMSAGPRPRAGENSNFAAPKSLAQIRAEKRKPESLIANGVAKRVQREAAAEGDDEFEGPKPLQELLKEKQKVADDVQGSPSLGEEEQLTGKANGAGESEIVSSPIMDLPENGEYDLIDDDDDGDDFARKLNQFFT